MKNRRYIAYVFLLGALVVLPSFARLIPSAWIVEPKEVTRRSDLIVIAEPVSTVHVGGATNEIRDGLEPPYGVSYQRALFVPANTTFDVITVLRGKVSTNRLVLFHYVWNGGEKARVMYPVNPPSLVSFTDHRTYPSPSLLQDFVPPKYLLFLTKLNDGRFRATTGQVDPEYSVQRLVPESRFNRLADDYIEAVGEKRQSAPRELTR